MEALLQKVQCGICGDSVELAQAVVCHHCGALLCDESTCRINVTAAEFASGAPPAAHCPNCYQTHHNSGAHN